MPTDMKEQKDESETKRRKMSSSVWLSEIHMELEREREESSRRQREGKENAHLFFFCSAGIVGIHIDFEQSASW